MTVHLSPVSPDYLTALDAADAVRMSHAAIVMRPNGVDLNRLHRSYEADTNRLIDAVAKVDAANMILLKRALGR